MALEDKDPLMTFDVDEKVAATIRAQLEDDKLPCAVAFAIAEAGAASPAQIGRTADALQIRLSRCQLGLFGYPGKQGWAEAGVSDLTPPVGLEAAIQEVANAKGQIACARLWTLAEQFACSRMLVGYLADALDIQIVACQLGAF